MSKIYSDEVKEIVYKKKRMIEGVRCDICDRMIPPYKNWILNEASRYFVVMTGHNDWGNDSCDSIECQDICPGCIDKFVSEYLKNCSETGYMEIRTAYVSPNDFKYD